MKLLLFLTSDVQNQLDKVPTFDYEKSMNSIHPAFHLRYVPGQTTLNFFGSSINLIDTIGLFFLLIGMITAALAAMQDNGRWKRAGYMTIIASWSALVFSHFMIAGGLSYKSFFAHWKMAIMILLSQLMFFALPALLYYLAASNLEFYDLTSDTKFLETSQKQFTYTLGIELFTLIFIFIVGILL